jgi:ribose 5-phosphate isomerase A
LTTSSLESAFEKLAQSAARDLVAKGSVLGLGSGSSVARFAKALGDRVKRESLNVTVVPSSMQSWILASTNGLILANDSAHCPAEIDIAVDGADQISVSTRSMIKGGGGALLKEKIIISSAKKCFILADESKFVERLNRPVPVEVTQFSTLSVEHKLRTTLGANPVLRKLDKGYPFFTESGNLILDVELKEAIADPRVLEDKIKTVPGVVEAGIFNNPVTTFYRANQNGTFDSF